MTGIYKITSPSGKVYVGSSINIKKRWNSYASLHCKSQVRLLASFNKYGVNNHAFEILELCDNSVLYKREIYWSNAYNVLGVNGLNCRIPSDKDTKAQVSQETRNRLSLAGIGKNRSKPTKETRLKMSLAKIGKPLPESTKVKMRGKTNWAKGKKFSAEYRKKISDGLMGKMAHNKIIILNTATGIFYDSIKEASQSTTYGRSYISRMLSGVNKNKTNFIYA